MKRTLLPWGLILLLMIALPQPDMAQPGDRDGRCFGDGPGFGRGQGMCQDRGFDHGDGRGILAKAEALGLTAEQITKIKAMRLETAKVMIRLRSDLEVKQLELQELMAEDKPDQVRIEAKIDEMAPLKTALQKKRITQHLAMRNVLTAEQKEKLEVLRGTGMRDRHGPRHGHRGPGRG